MSTSETHMMASSSEFVRFEAMLADISSVFVHLKPEEVDGHITETLQKLVEFFDFDQAILLQIGSDTFSYLTHQYTVPGAAQNPHVPTREELPWFYSRTREAREPFLLQSVDDLPSDAHMDRTTLRRFGIRSLLAIPLFAGVKVVGHIGIRSYRGKRSMAPKTLERLCLVGSIISSALERKESDASLRELLSKVEHLRDQLQADNSYLREELRQVRETTVLLGQSPEMRRVLGQIRQVAGTTASVLILGETGVGKELAGRAIHDASGRGDRPMISVNCAGLPDSLVENELFGHERGAFTGAVSKQPGRFELADGSTLFLDEIGDLPLQAQAKLLRVLEEGKLERLGGTRSIQVDVRILAATNRDLTKMVREGRFREDLFFRLNVYPLTIPPLRNRPGDIPLLTEAFLREFSQKTGKTLPCPAPEALSLLRDYKWPGNVRELRNIVERAAIAYQGVGPLEFSLPGRALLALGSFPKMEEMEREHIIRALLLADGKIAGPGGAAEFLGLNRNTLVSRMRKLGITRNVHYS